MNNSFDKAIQSMRDALYYAILAAIIELVKPFMEKNPDGIKCSLLYRYIDADLMQSVYRIKRVKVEDGKVFVLADSDKGETPADELDYNYEEDWENESMDDLSSRPFVDSFWLDYIQSIYHCLKEYDIPKLSSKDHVSQD